jgi:hypothetical protein
MEVMLPTKYIINVFRMRGALDVRLGNCCEFVAINSRVLPFSSVHSRFSRGGVQVVMEEGSRGYTPLVTCGGNFYSMSPQGSVPSNLI